jgi:hypothetical protein
MKPLLNIVRAVIFIIVIYFLLRFVFFFFDWGGGNAMVYLGEIKEKMNQFLFWLLFAFFGIVILIILWLVFKYLSILVMALLVLICPYRSFSAWSVGIMSVIYSCFFLFHYWFLGRHRHHSLTFRDVMFGLILICACIQLCVSLVEGVFFSYKIKEATD